MKAGLDVPDSIFEAKERIEQGAAAIHEIWFCLLLLLLNPMPLNLNGIAAKKD